MNRRSLQVGLASFVVTGALIAGCWAMALADRSGSQRVSHAVEEPLGLEPSGWSLFWEEAAALRQAHPALDALLPRELRLGELLFQAAAATQ